MNLNIFKLPTPAQAAASELAQAELSLLAAHTAAEQAEAHLLFQQGRVERLRQLVHAGSGIKITNQLPVIDTEALLKAARGDRRHIA